MELEMKKIRAEDLARLYPVMEEHFPREELKRQPHLEQQLRSGPEEGWFFCLNGREIGYAMIIRHPEIPFVLLDYFAMYAENRNLGYGRRCLRMLQEKYPCGLLAEVEDTEDSLSAEENALRLRRIGFYQREGFVPIPFENSIFTVRYLVHLWIPELPEQPARAAAWALDRFYALQLPEEIYRRMIDVPLAHSSQL